NLVRLTIGAASLYDGADGKDDRVLSIVHHKTADDVEKVLQIIHVVTREKIYTVVGSGGDRDRSKRPLMAEAALKYSDLAIFTSDNPRSEKPSAILKDMTNTLSKDHFEVIENREKAIQRAIQLAETGDVVLIAGKGHETYQ